MKTTNIPIKEMSSKDAAILAQAAHIGVQILGGYQMEHCSTFHEGNEEEFNKITFEDGQIKLIKRMLIELAALFEVCNTERIGHYNPDDKDAIQEFLGLYGDYCRHFTPSKQLPDNPLTDIINVLGAPDGEILPNLKVSLLKMSEAEQAKVLDMIKVMQK